MEFLQAPVLGVAAGLNPYVTVALTAVFAWRSDLVPLNPAFAFVGTSAVFLVALLLLPIDLFADKFPGSGGLMDRVGWVLRPVAGGLAGAAVMPDHPAAIVAGLALGAVAAAGMHGLRLHLRRRLQWRMLGFGRLALGAYADLTSGIVAAVVLLTAPAGAVIAALALAAALLADRRWGAPEPAASPSDESDEGSGCA